MKPEQIRAHRKEKDNQMVNVIIGVATVFFGLCAAVAFVFAVSVVKNSFTITNVQPKDLLMPMIACFGVLLAVLAFMRDWNKIQIDRMEVNAKILYEQAKEGLERAFSLLEHTTQDPQSWLSASRLILQSQNLGRSIDGHSYYATAYEIAEHNVQVKLRSVLCASDGSPLPAAFFFGYENWSDPTLDLNDVHNKTLPSPQLYTVGSESNTVVSSFKLSHLNPKAVVAVMDFIHETQNFSQDPLDAIDVAQYKQWHEYAGVSQGARRYIEKLQKQ